MPELTMWELDSSGKQGKICDKCGQICVPISLSYCDWQTNPNQDNEQINVSGFHCIECNITYKV